MAFFEFKLLFKQLKRELKAINESLSKLNQHFSEKMNSFYLRT